MYVEKIEAEWPARPEEIEYPDSDGQPVAENTLQFDWIVLLRENLDVIVPDFVAADLLWYPIEGDPKCRLAPDALVAFGRPKGYRSSYKQWEEGGVAPQVVFEVLSPGNRYLDLKAKHKFYDRFGVEEYYLVDPYNSDVVAHTRVANRLVVTSQTDTFVSPRLGVRFAKNDGKLVIYGPDGQPFSSLGDEKRRSEDEKRRADNEKRRADALAEKLRALGVDPDK